MNDKGYTRGYETAKQDGSAVSRNNFLMKYITENLKISVNDKRFGAIFEEAYEVFNKTKYFNHFCAYIKEISSLSSKDARYTKSHNVKTSEIPYGHGADDAERVLEENKVYFAADELAEKDKKDELLYKIDRVMNKRLNEREKAVVRYQFDIGYNMKKNEKDFNNIFERRLSRQRINQIRDKGLKKMRHEVLMEN